MSAIFPTVAKTDCLRYRMRNTPKDDGPIYSGDGYEFVWKNKKFKGLSKHFPLSYAVLGILWNIRPRMLTEADLRSFRFDFPPGPISLEEACRIRSIIDDFFIQCRIGLRVHLERSPSLQNYWIMGIQEVTHILNPGCVGLPTANRYL